jgi:TolA-binding protein
MNGYVVAGLLLLCVVTGFVSYWRGTVHGELIVHADVAQSFSKATSAVIANTKRQVQQAAAETERLRNQATQLETAHAKTTKQLQAALAANRKLRGCLLAHLPPDIVQQLAAARADATHRAATGAPDDAVRTTTGVAGATAHE